MVCLIDDPGRAVPGTHVDRRNACAEAVANNRPDRAVLVRADSSVLESLAINGGKMTRWQRAAQAVEGGATSPAEVRRLLGLR